MGYDQEKKSSVVCKLQTTEIDGFRWQKYNTDVIDDEMFNSLMVILKSPKQDVFQKWITTFSTSIDEKSKLKAYDLFDSGDQ